MMDYLVVRHRASVNKDLLQEVVRLSLPSLEKRTLLDWMYTKGLWDVNENIESGFTILRYATIDVNVVGYFLDRGADPNLGRHLDIWRAYWGADRLVHTSGAALDAAVRHRNVETVEILVQRGATMDNADVIHAAIENDDEIMLKKLLELGADLYRIERFSLDSGDAPLLSAITQGKVRMVRVLLEWGAELSRSGKHGVTPLEMVTKGWVNPQIRQMVVQASREERSTSTNARERLTSQ
ncbi:ankyrin repeat-containing domain protein [Massariosphaeria phaeospora]|uniref:Ankyrin repeat-containing domain protein n=1 Tax=Massariosphaeria phaeospora TaxID=100035 RepID=A0A7C8MG77_9PLEO|nr:ankyrin repeat-containing domain protein [Massariosphaeria phaeospora]